MIEYRMASSMRAEMGKRVTSIFTSAVVRRGGTRSARVMEYLS